MGFFAEGGVMVSVRLKRASIERSLCRRLCQISNGRCCAEWSASTERYPVQQVIDVTADEELSTKYTDQVPLLIKIPSTGVHVHTCTHRPNKQPTTL